MAGKNGVRNKEILAAFEKGAPLAELAARYGLAITTIYSILTMEKHRRAVAEDAIKQER